MEITRLEHEAHRPMAEMVTAAIVDEAGRWPGVRGAVDHRTGSLALVDIAMVVTTSAPHRADAFAAWAFVIDRLKQDAPVWKREHDADGITWVGLGP